MKNYKFFLIILGVLIFIVNCQTMQENPDDNKINNEINCFRPEQGCTCEPGQESKCYSNEPLASEDGEKICFEGTRYCSDDGIWGECEGLPSSVEEGEERGINHYAILGTPELCGGCDPNCFKVHDCPTAPDLNQNNSNNVMYDVEKNGLVLGGKILNTRYAWVANSPDSSVSKIDLSNGACVGKYLVGLPGHRCSCWGGWCGNIYGCNLPSRTAIDSKGNAYVANRAFDIQGTVTKMAGAVDYCYDRNRNGVIETSTGCNDLRNWGADECVLWTVNVDGVNNNVPRALAIDKDDKIWIGLYSSPPRFAQLDPNDGHLIQTIKVNSYPYGAVITGDGKLWFPHGCCGRSYIEYIDTVNNVKGSRYINNSGCNGSYSIAADQKNRVWVAGYPEACIARYDPASSTWTKFTTTSTYARGVTVDGSGRVWATAYGGGSIFTSWNMDTGGDRKTYKLSGCSTPIGIGADFEGNIWTPCNGSNNVAKLNPSTGVVTLYKNVVTGAYTYSDFTGWLRANVTSPEGYFVRRHDEASVCDSGENIFWSQLYWDADTPVGSEILFWAKTAERTTDLGLAQEIMIAAIPGDSEPVDISQILSRAGIPNGQRFMEIRVQLKALDGTTSPVFRNMDLVYYCQCQCDTTSSCDAGCLCDSDC